MINVAAPINSLGYGVVGLNTVLALYALGHEPSLWPIGNMELPSKLAEWRIRLALRRAERYDRTAPSLRIWHQFDLAQHVGKGVHAALPIFELDRFTETELHHLKQQDIVFATSGFAWDVLREAGIPKERLRLVSFGVDPKIFRPRPPVRFVTLDADEKVSQPPPSCSLPTTFLNCGKWEVRKGHDVLVDVFNKAFAKDDHVMLVMNCHNPCVRDPNYNKQFADLYKNSPLGDKIVIPANRLGSQTELAALMAECDCGVFLSRAEGWNLDAAEMLAMGKQLIITRCTAHMEYCTRENAMFVDVDETEAAHDGVWFHGQGRWARLGDDQVDQAVEHMRAIHRLKQEGKLAVNQAGIDTMGRFTWGRTATEIMKGIA